LTVAHFAAAHGIHHIGVLGDGFTPLDVITSELPLAADGAEVLLVCLPTQAHGVLARHLIDADIRHIPLVLNPGHTGGALEFTHVYRQQGIAPPPVAELSTLTYVARLGSTGQLRVTGRARSVGAAALPGGASALGLALSLYDCARPVRDVLATGLANVNLVLHPPGAILGAAWVEATRGNFTFYVEGLTAGVARVMESLDAERRAVAHAFDIQLPTLIEEMRAIGTIESEEDSNVSTMDAIRSGIANRAIMAPGSFAHRYFQEDLWYGLKPFLALAEITGVDTPCARSLMQLGELAAGPYAPAGARTAAEMGIAGLDRNAVLKFVTERLES
jgi:opine dehydrogenase